MRFTDRKRIIEEGDVVVLLGQPQYIIINISKDAKTSMKFGTFSHNEIIGKPYGSKIISCCKKKGHVYALFPSAYLWMKSLPHRTQIIYSTNISQILFFLDLKPGSIVVESGTGSGSLSHSIANCIFPNGKLYTFEYNEHRFTEAKDEFTAHGYNNLIDIRHLDVCSEGFVLKPDGNTLEDCVDAVIIDLPKPHLAVAHAYTVLKKSGSGFCSFSPCIEQVQKVVRELEKYYFKKIKTIECLEKPIFFDKKIFHNTISSNNDIGCYESINQNNEKNDLTEIIPLKRDKINDTTIYSNNYEKIRTTSKKDIPGHTGFLTFAYL